MTDPEVLRDNYSTRRGKSTAGGMPSWALLAKMEQTGVKESVNQLREFHRSELRDFSCEKPWLECDMPINGGIDPVTGQSRSGGSMSRSMINLRNGGARNNTSPNLPDGTFLDHEYLDNSDEYIGHNNKFEKNYTAGKAGVSRKHGNVNWEEYNRQLAYRGKYIKYYNDGDYSTVEHGLNPAEAQKNKMKARFVGLKMLKRNGRVHDGRKSGMTPFFERGGEKKYHHIDQVYREEKLQKNYRQHRPDDTNIGQNYVDHDQNATDNKLGMDNHTYNAPGDVQKAQESARLSERILQAFSDNNVKSSLAYIISTLNNTDAVHSTQRTTEGFTNSQRKLGVQQFGGGSEIQMSSVESRAYEIARVLQKEVRNRKLAAQEYSNIQMNSVINTKIHEYMNMASRKLGPQEITLNLKDAALRTNLQPGAEVMDFMNSNRKSLAMDVLDLPRSQLNAKIAHYRDDSRSTINFSNVHPKVFKPFESLEAEDYGDESSNTINYKSARKLHEGLKSAYFSDDMSFSEGMVDNAHRSKALGKGQTRRAIDTTHGENRNDDDGHMNEVGHNVRN